MGLVGQWVDIVAEKWIGREALIAVGSILDRDADGPVVYSGSKAGFQVLEDGVQVLRLGSDNAIAISSGRRDNIGSGSNDRRVPHPRGGQMVSQIIQRIQRRSTRFKLPDGDTRRTQADRVA